MTCQTMLNVPLSRVGSTLSEIILTYIFYPHIVGSKMSPRPSLIPDAAEVHHFHVSSSETIEKETESSSHQNLEKNEPNKTANRASSCRVCLKSFKPDDFSKTCFECKFRVCEDCASYSKVDSAEDLVSFYCYSN
jgi:hypothetical protein